MAFSFGGGTNNTSFGAAKPAFTSSFSFGGATSTPAATGFSGFGATTTTTPASGFGGFGTAPSSAAPGFGGFGGAPAATSAPSMFGGGTGFGSTAAKPNTTTAFGGAGAFGTAAPSFTAGTSFGAGTSAFGAGTSFGQAGTSFGSSFGAAAPTFGATPNTGFGGFGAKPATTTSGFGGFGTGFGTKLPVFGNQPQQQQQQQQSGPQNANEALLAAVFNCHVFGDERDQILAKWNFLQAKWGVGQAYYSNSAQPLQLTQQNPLCKFKAIGYSALPTHKERDGLVALMFQMTLQQIKSQQTQLITSLSALLGNKPNLTVTVDSVKSLAENKTQVIIYVLDRSTNPAGVRITASELATFLNQPGPRAQLTNAQCPAAPAPMLPPNKEQLDAYLNTPPPGIDNRLWKQAQTDNPNPDKYIPMPMVGFSEVKWRAECCESEAALQSAWLASATKRLSDIRARQAEASARTDDARTRQMRLHRKLLQVVIRLETCRRVGAALTPEEEALSSRLECLQAQLTTPTHLNGRLSELLSQMRMQRCQTSVQGGERYQMDPGAEDDMKQFLSMQQKGMAHLIDTANKDLASLKIIHDGLAPLLPQESQT